MAISKLQAILDGSEPLVRKMIKPGIYSDSEIINPILVKLCELPPPYGGGLHEFQLMLSGVFPSLLLNVFANDLLIHADCGHEVAV